MADVESITLLHGTKKSNVRKHLRKYGVAVILSIFSILSVTLLYHTIKSDIPLDSPVEFKGHLVTGTKGAVAVEAEECSNIGVDILKKGGNAVDAAIASTLCIGVIDSFATGIGGGGFMLIRSPNGTFEFIDFRETAPEAATPDMFVKDPLLARIGGLSVAVPGELRGLELAHKRHGRLPWQELFEPSIKLARSGFRATKLLEIRVKASELWMRNCTEWSNVFFQNGRAIKEGDIVRRPRLADTLAKVAAYGADAFYEGEIAESLVKSIQNAGGVVTLKDFKDYRPVIRPTMSTYYNGRKVTTCSQPTSGPMLLGVLNLLERYQFKATKLTGLNIHRLIEAFKFGFAYRTEMGDPDFVDNRKRIDEIVTKDYAAKVRQKITDNSSHGPLYYGPKYDHIESHGTMHLSVVDENDGAVALTSTVNLIFGSHIMDDKTGVVLNDEMDDFSIPGSIPNEFNLFPSPDNYAGPKKRPLSSITPTIIEKDAHFELAIGGSGGSMIPTATITAIVNLIDFGKDLYSSIASPRAHHQLLPNLVVLEHGYSKETQRELETKKHVTLRIPSEYSISAVQAVRRLTDGTVEAASDPRKMGQAAAY